MPTTAWDSPIIKCRLCRSPGCRYRAVADSEYCCQGCSGKTVTPGGSVPTARGVIPDQDKFHASREPPNAVSSDESTCGCSGRQHDAGCAMLEMDVLQRSWWEELPCDNASEVFGQTQTNAACLVVPPLNEAAAIPAPVILFLGGDGHVDDKQDFYWGGIDLLIRNTKLCERFFLIAPKPTSTCGLLRINDKWKRTWSEDSVWVVLTEVLRRLGPSRVDASRIHATGLSLGAIGVWNLATRYGQHLASIAPVAGACEWPGGSWPHGSTLDEGVLARMKDLPIRAYQIDVDPNSGRQKDDMEEICRNLVASERDLVLPGMEKEKTCNVHVREWCGKSGGPTWELWTAKGPLNDWSAWDEWGGDKHFLWQRAYPLLEWGLADFFLSHVVPESRCWQFDAPPTVLDMRGKIVECMMTATKDIVAIMTNPWQEQVREFAQKFFDALCCICGDRPWLDNVDFTSTILYGVQANLVHLLPCLSLPQFQEEVRKATYLGVDKVRYNLRSFAILRSAVEGKRSQVQVREAVDRAREEVALEMLEMKVDEFVKTWISKVKDKLEKESSLQCLPRMSALKLFRGMVTDGGGIPVPLMPQMQGISLEDWPPLTRTVNRLFDDPEPPQKRWKDWDNSWSESKASGTIAGRDKSWDNSWKAGTKAWDSQSSGESWATQQAMQRMMQSVGRGAGWGGAVGNSWDRNSGRGWGPY